MVKGFTVQKQATLAFVMEKSLLDENTFLSGSGDHNIKLRHIYTKECIHTFTGHNQCVWSVCPLDKNRFLSVSGDKTIKLWHINTKECLCTFTGHTNSIYSICRLDENRFLSGSYDQTIKLWQVPTLTLKDYCNFFPFQKQAVLAFER